MDQAIEALIAFNTVQEQVKPKVYYLFLCRSYNSTPSVSKIVLCKISLDQNCREFTERYFIYCSCIYSYFFYSNEFNFK